MYQIAWGQKERVDGYELVPEWPPPLFQSDQIESRMSLSTLTSTQSHFEFGSHWTCSLTSSLFSHRIRILLIIGRFYDGCYLGGIDN